MGHENDRVGGGAAYSTMHPVVMVIMIIAAVFILLLPRKYAVVPFLLAIFLTPFAQAVYVGGVHVFVPRMLILIGWIRICWVKLSSQERIVPGGFTRLDKLFLVWAIVRSLATFLEFVTALAALNQFAYLWDVLGGFFLLRFLIRDEEDIERVIKTFAFIAVILGLTMTGEKLFDRNVFGYIGGIAPHVRIGAIRAAGSLSGSIQCGTFGATLLCLFAWLWMSGKARLLAAAGIIGSTTMVVTSSSSTPILAWLGAILAISMWPIRKSMRKVRWGIVILLILLQMVMKAPVWFLINHLELVPGNSGFHRAIIIDGFFRHFSEWWLIGVKSTNSWGTDMWDQANQFVTEGESGGLASFICFVWMVSWVFSRVGKARKLVEGDRKREWMFWLLGAALFAYVVSFFGIEFDDAAIFSWFAFLVIVIVATVPVLERKTVRESVVSKAAITRGQLTLATARRSPLNRVAP